MVERVGVEEGGLSGLGWGALDRQTDRDWQRAREREKRDVEQDERFPVNMHWSCRKLLEAGVQLN